MTGLLCAVLLAPAAAAAPAPAAVKSSTSAPAAVASPIGQSTYTVSTLYTGDRVRDPFLPAAMGGAAARRPEEKAGPTVVDIHALTLRGIMQDGRADYALFMSESGMTLMLRGGKLYDDRNKPVPGIAGRIRIKQKRAELVTAEKDVQIYSLGESNDEDQDRSKSR